MARKSRTSAEKLMAHDEKKAALADYARANQALRDKSARLQALRLAQGTKGKDGDEPSADAAAPAPSTKTAGAKTKRAAKSKSASLIWKS
jgi:hypothetical protein